MSDADDPDLALASGARNGRGFWLEFYGSEGTLVLGSENQ